MKNTLNNWSNYYAANVLIASDFGLMLVGLVWICHSLRFDRHVMGNEKWMAILTGLLLLVLGANIYNSVICIQSKQKGVEDKSYRLAK